MALCVGVTAGHISEKITEVEGRCGSSLATGPTQA